VSTAEVRGQIAEVGSERSRRRDGTAPLVFWGNGLKQSGLV